MRPGMLRGPPLLAWLTPWLWVLCGPLAGDDSPAPLARQPGPAFLVYFSKQSWLRGRESKRLKEVLESLPAESKRTARELPSNPLILWLTNSVDRLQSFWSFVILVSREAPTCRVRLLSGVQNRKFGRALDCSQGAESREAEEPIPRWVLPLALLGAECPESCLLRALYKPPPHPLRGTHPFLPAVRPPSPPLPGSLGWGLSGA